MTGRNQGAFSREDLKREDPGNEVEKATWEKL